MSKFKPGDIIHHCDVSPTDDDYVISIKERKYMLWEIDFDQPFKEDAEYVEHTWSLVTSAFREDDNES